MTNEKAKLPSGMSEFLYVFLHGGYSFPDFSGHSKKNELQVECSWNSAWCGAGMQ